MSSYIVKVYTLKGAEKMIVEMDLEAKKWIKSKGSQVTVKILDIKTCCAPGVQELVALPGKPKTPVHYQQFTSENIIFFIHKSVGREGKLLLTLSGPPFLKSLSVKLL